MPDLNYSVWNLTGVPELPREKQVEVLQKLQNRVHELFDTLHLAEQFLEANCHYVNEMAPIYRALGKKVPEEKIQSKVVPEGYPPHDPWGLLQAAQNLNTDKEKEAEMQKKIDALYIDEKQYGSDGNGD